MTNRTFKPGQAVTIPPYPSRMPTLGCHLEAIAGDLATKINAGLYDALDHHQKADLRGLSIEIALLAERVTSLEGEATILRRRHQRLERSMSTWWRQMVLRLARQP